jgi:hypothetical protein
LSDGETLVEGENPDRHSKIISHARKCLMILFIGVSNFVLLYNYMEKIPTQLSFEDFIKERFASQRISYMATERVFNFVEGGFQAIDNACLDEGEKKEIIRKIQEVAGTFNENNGSFDNATVMRVVKEINLIIDSAL